MVEASERDALAAQVPDVVIQEVLVSIERAIVTVKTLHIGPIDYNISTTVDDLLAAVVLLERLGDSLADEGARNVRAGS